MAWLCPGGVVVRSPSDGQGLRTIDNTRQGWSCSFSYALCYSLWRCARSSRSSSIATLAASTCSPLRSMSAQQFMHKRKDVANTLHVRVLFPRRHPPAHCHGPAARKMQRAVHDDSLQQDGKPKRRAPEWTRNSGVSRANIAYNPATPATVSHPQHVLKKDSHTSQPLWKARAKVPLGGRNRRPQPRKAARHIARPLSSSAKSLLSPTSSGAALPCGTSFRLLASCACPYVSR